MGDFERTFGEGADIEAIIDGISRSVMAEERRQSRGDRQRLFFPTYEEAVVWENANKDVPFIRRRKGDGYEVKLVK